MTEQTPQSARSELHKKIAAGTTWTALDGFGSRVLQLLVLTIMARLLTPYDFGIVAIALFFLAFGSALERSGFTFAYIRDHEEGADAFGTLQALNLATALVVVLVLLAISQPLATLYGDPVLASVLMVLSFAVLIDGLISPLRAHCEKSLNFKTVSIARVTGLFVSAIAAITSAYLGAGLWALVLQQIVQRCVVLLLLVWWGQFPAVRRPRLARAHAYFNYGLPLQIAGLLNIMSREINVVAIGNVGSVSAAGLYSRANNLQALLVQTTVATVEKVAFPALSKVREDKANLIDWTRKSNRIYSFLIYPCLATMFVTSDELVLTLFGSQWIEAGKYLQFLIVIGWVRFLQSCNLTLLKVHGETKIALKLRFVEAILMISMLFLAMPFGIIGLIAGQIIASYFSYAVIALVSQRITRYKIAEQLQDILFNAILAVISASLTLGIVNFVKSEIDLIYIGQCTILITTLFLGLAAVFKRPEIAWLLHAIRLLRARSRNPAS